MAIATGAGVSLGELRHLTWREHDAVRLALSDHAAEQNKANRRR